MKKLLLILLLSCFSLQVNSKPLKFHGLDWSMEIGEMIEALEEKGYSCARLDPSVPIACEQEPEKWEQIYISDKTIELRCGAYNGCAHSHEQLVAAISHRYGVEALYVEKTLFEGNAQLEYTYNQWEWRGDGGDLITLEDTRGNTFLPYKHSIWIHKGSFGQTLDF